MQAKETEDQALISSSSTFKFVYEDYNYSVMKPDTCFLFESLALQDYNKKVPDE